MQSGCTPRTDVHRGQVSNCKTYISTTASPGSLFPKREKSYKFYLLIWIYISIGTASVASKPGGRKALTNTAAPKLSPLWSCYEGNFAWRRPCRTNGKADVLWEGTVKCTTEAAGVGVLASRERFSEITTGKFYFHGLTATGKDFQVQFGDRSRIAKHDVLFEWPLEL